MGEPFVFCFERVSWQGWEEGLDVGYRCSIWNSVSRLWTKDMGIEMLDGAWCSLPRERQPYDRTTEAPMTQTGTRRCPGRASACFRKDRGGVCVQPNSQ